MLGPKTQLAGFVLKTEWSGGIPREWGGPENPSHLWPRSPGEAGWVGGNAGKLQQALDESLWACSSLPLPPTPPWPRSKWWFWHWDCP